MGSALRHIVVMATSLLRSGVGKAKAAKNHVDESLEKVKAKSWASPLGKALEVSSKVVGAVEGFVSGANIIGGALAFGATLLNPEPSMEDLQKELRDIKATLEATNSRAIIQALEKAQLELEERIAHPIGEVKTEIGEVTAEMKRVFVEIGKSHKTISDEISGVKDVTNKTFLVVVDHRFKDGIEKVEAAYEVFLRVGFKNFESYYFEMQTVAIQNLNPQRVKEYLGMIYQHQGLAACQATMEFVFAVMGKYLQMVVAYSIFESEPDQVVHHFEQFNSDFYEACAAFKEVTHHVFKAGQKVEVLKPVVPVIPVKRQPTLELGLP